MDVDAATRTMIENIPAKTGRALAEWFDLLDAAGVEKHGQALALLKSHGVSHGFANLIATMHRNRDAADTDLVAAQYAGRKAALRPLYERVVAIARGFGEDVEVAPRKTAVALRRGRQFAYLEVPSAARLVVGLNLAGVEPTGRLLTAGGMCTHRVLVTAESDIDAELIGWLRAAYERA